MWQGPKSELPSLQRICPVVWHEPANYFLFASSRMEPRRIGGGAIFLRNTLAFRSFHSSHNTRSVIEAMSLHFTIRAGHKTRNSMSLMSTHLLGSFKIDSFS